MGGHRHFGFVRLVSSAGGLVIERADGLGRVYLPAKEAAMVGAALQPGDRLIFSILPGGEGCDVDILD
jgi:hypothetical protein